MIIFIIFLNIFGSLVFELAIIFSILTTILTIGYLFRKWIYQSNYLYKITFDHESEIWKLWLSDRITGEVWSHELSYETVEIKLATKPIFNLSIGISHGATLADDQLSQTRILDIYGEGRRVATLQVDLSGWCRHPQIDDLLERLGKFKSIDRHPNQ